MEQKPTIKMLDNSHCNAIVNLILPIQREEFGVAITVEDQPDLLDIDGFYKQTGGGFWGVVCNGNVVGTIALINTGHGAGVIRKMFVRKDFRGKQHGIASALMQHLLQKAECLGMADIYLGTVHNMKAAHRFYEKNGFVGIEKQALPAYFPLMAADNMFYHLHLADVKHQA